MNLALRMLSVFLILPSAALSASRPADAEPARSRPYNIVLIAVDGLRPDHLGLYGYNKPTSPLLDEFSRKAVVFERAYAAATWTLPSFGTMFTGLPPREHKSVSPFPSPILPDVPLFTEHFSANGFRVAGFIGGYYLSPIFGFARGFDLYRAGGWGVWQFLPSTSKLGAEWIVENASRRFFLLIHGNDMHPPFGLPSTGEHVSLRINDGRVGGLVDRNIIDYHFVVAFDVAQRNVREFLGFVPDNKFYSFVEEVRADPAEMARITAHYDNRIANVDLAVKNTFAALASAGRIDDTIVLLIADHGLELGEHDKLGVGFHASVAEQSIRVPLIVWHPAVAGRRIRDLVSLQDLGATLLELANLQAGNFPGRSFAPLIRGEKDPHAPRRILASASLIKRNSSINLDALIDGSWKIVLDASTGGARLYNLEKDPGEHRDLWDRENARGLKLKNLLMTELAAQAARQK